MPFSQDPDVVASLVSAGRFRPYREASGGDGTKAIALYQWGVALSTACFEAFHYVEVVTRNALDREMRAYFHDDQRLIPWFLLRLPGCNQDVIDRQVDSVRARLRDQSTKRREMRETRDQIVAGVDFGFWVGLLKGAHEDLWRKALYKAFPNSSGKRKDVLIVLEELRLFRNKLAHHDSLLSEDVPTRLQQMLDVLGWVSADAKEWLSEVEQVSAVYARRPVARRDTVVVAAGLAWNLYQTVPAYVCQAGRSFQSVDHLAFYADQEIKAEVPAVLRRLDNVDWSPANEARLLSSPNPADQRLGRVIQASRGTWTEGRYQVFDLTSPGDPKHVTLPRPIPHLLKGKGSAFTQRQRYTVCHDLKRARSTTDLT